MKFLKFWRLFFLSPLFLMPVLLQASTLPRFYVGAGGGWQFWNVNTDMQGLYFQNNFGGTHNFNNNVDSGFGNLFMGVENTIGKAYWALEANLFYDNTTMKDTYVVPYTPPFTSTTNNIESKMKWRYDFSFILGRYLTPKFLGYGKLGVTTGPLQTTFTAYDSNNAQVTSAFFRNWAYGGVAGLGAQYLLNSHWRVGIEGDYMRFFKVASTVNTIYFGTPTQVTMNAKPQSYTIKAMISYVF